MNGEARAESMQFKWMVVKNQLFFQTQYVFIHEALFEAFRHRSHAVLYREFAKEFKKLCGGDQPTNENPLRMEYNVSTVKITISVILSTSISHMRNYFLCTTSRRIKSVLWLSGRLGDWVHEADLSTVPIQGSPEGHQQDEKQGGRGHAR